MIYIKKEYWDTIKVNPDDMEDVWDCMRSVDVVGLLGWIEQKLKEACKEQRENCSKFFDNFPDSTEWRNTKEIRNVILNAPEPEGEIK